MSKQTEALKLALEAFEADASNENFLVLKHCVREALAEQPALLAANKDLQNHFDALMNDYKKLSALCSSQGTRLMEYESSHEPESKPWVGLTTDEMIQVKDRFKLSGVNIAVAFRTIEAKLREKNAPQQSKEDA